MYDKLDTETLKTGETLDIGVVTTPEEAVADGIRSLLGHKGTYWQEHVDAALRGETDLLETRFYLGLLDGEPVSNLMTVERLGIGILGHVFTRPEQRRKGICSAVMARQMAHFRERGGHVLLLGTGFESPPYWIYHSFGFRSLDDGFMRYAAEEPEFEARWLAPGPVQAVPAQWSHWPLVALLASQPADAFVRSVAWGLLGIGNLEGPYCRFMEMQREDTSARGVMLETEQGAVVGCATVTPHRPWPGAWLVDLFGISGLPGNDYAGALLAALPLPRGHLVAYVDEGSSDKARALEHHGFRRAGNLERFVSAGPGPNGPRHDVVIYHKNNT